MIQLLILSLCNNTILLVMYKWKWIEKYELYKKKWFPDWCELCLFFWCSMVEHIILNLGTVVSFYPLFLIFAYSLASTFVSLLTSKLYARL